MQDAAEFGLACFNKVTLKRICDSLNNSYHRFPSPFMSLRRDSRRDCRARVIRCFLTITCLRARSENGLSTRD